MKKQKQSQGGIQVLSGTGSRDGVGVSRGLGGWFVARFVGRGDVG